MESAGLEAIREYGLALVAVVVLTGAVAFFVRDLIKQRDKAMALAESAVTAFDRLVDQLDVQPVIRPRRNAREEKP